jgi:20S proteasome subunit beta 1
MEDEPVTVYRTAQIFRKFLYEYRDQLGASIILAGYDEQKGGQVYI